MSQVVATPITTNSMTGLLLPLADRTLLLPNVALAEVVPYRSVQVQDGLPDWLLGLIEWRDLRLPLLSFECASGAELPEDHPTRRIAVLNAVGGREHVKFIAILLQGIPRSVRIGTDLAEAPDVPLTNLEKLAVDLGENGHARIPDLVGLEQKLVDAGLL